VQGVESSMEIIKAIIKACRSLRSQYNIGNKVLTTFFVKTSSEEAINAIINQTDDIKTLGKAKEVKLNPAEADVPPGVGIVIVDEQTTVLMDLTGMVDFKAEIAKLTKALNKTLPVLTILEKKMNAPGYAEKVSAALKTANEEKLAGLRKKADDMNDAIANFKKLAEMESSA